MPSIGTIIDGRYELRRDLGGGGGGVVFEARHLFTHRSVAVKLVGPDAGHADRDELRLRLQREAQALAAIRHPGVVEILDGGIAPDGAPYIVTEMLEGRTLEGLLAARGKLSVADAAGLTLQLCSALEAAHKAGVIHRDVKPSNIIITRDGLGFEHAKLIDFGVAALESASHKLTEVGRLVGTPSYMSPERLLAAPDVDHSSDVYAVGVIMFECLTGRLPYLGNYQNVLLRAASSEPIPSLVIDDPAGALLADVIGRAIAKRREDRFKNMTALADATRDAVPSATPRIGLLRQPALADLPSKPVATQRRRNMRASYLSPLRLMFATGSSLDCRIEDISEGGLLAITRVAVDRAQCAPGKSVSARFAQPVDGTIVSCEVVVRWVRASRPDDPHGAQALGLEFVALDPAVQAAITRYVTLMADPNQ